jgi:hypothetical protein
MSHAGDEETTKMITDLDKAGMLIGFGAVYVIIGHDHNNFKNHPPLCYPSLFKSTAHSGNKTILPVTSCVRYSAPIRRNINTSFLHSSPASSPSFSYPTHQVFQNIGSGGGMANLNTGDGMVNLNTGGFPGQQLVHVQQQPHCPAISGSSYSNLPHPQQYSPNQIAGYQGSISGGSPQTNYSSSYAPALNPVINQSNNNSVFSNAPNWFPLPSISMHGNSQLSSASVPQTHISVPPSGSTLFYQPRCYIYPLPYGNSMPGIKITDTGDLSELPSQFDNDN